SMDIFSATIALVVAFFAGFIGSTAGGAGLISVPILIFLGLPAHIAVATSRFGSLGVTSTGIYSFHQGKKVDFRLGTRAAVLGIIGSFFGAGFLLAIPSGILEKIIAFFLFISLFFMYKNRGFGIKKEKKKGKTAKALGYASFLFIGFLGGFVGGVVGILSSYVLILVFGQTFLESSGTRKIYGLAIGLTSTSVFALAGVIDWGFGLLMLPAFVAGTHFGVKYALSRGEGWVKALFAVVVAVSAIALLVS
ncbi:hypothetical protein COU37_00005, partial [Candidatus Micrarchaeota archaeon CG10_big_fil_rev_8_21_14_0_10_45_29]